MKKVLLRIDDNTPEGQAVAEWLDGLPWGARNRAIVSALYAAATGRQGQESAPAQPVQAAVDLYAIRRVVEAAVQTALSSAGVRKAPVDTDIRSAVDEAIDKLQIDIL